MNKSPEIPTLDQLNEQLEGWRDTLKKPLWYKEIMPVLLDFWAELPRDPETRVLKNCVYEYFANKLEANEVFLAQDGPNLDQWRAPINTVVIHYTGNNPGITWQELSATGLLRQYAQDFFKYDEVFGIPTKNMPVWSGHFRGDQQVFYAYHWIVRLDGSYERLLNDEYIGWQAGNKDVNFRSVGIVLDGEFVDNEPPIDAIRGVIRLIKENYPDISSSQNILGHLEVNPKTHCPGKLFLPSWKGKIIESL